MKQQNLLTKMLLLFALVVGSVTSVWAQKTKTISITISSFTNLPSTAAYASYDWTADGVSGKGTIFGGSSSQNMQMNGNNRFIYNTTAIPGTIKSITLTKASGSNRSFQVFGRSSAYDGSSETYGTQIGSDTNVDDKGKTFTVESGSYSFFVVRLNASNAAYLSSVVVTYEEESASAIDTSIDIDDSGITNTDVFIGTVAGSLSATVKDADDNEIDDASISWSSSKPDVAKIVEETGVITLVGTGTTTITANYAGVSGTYKASSKTYILTVTSSNPVKTINLNNELFNNVSVGSNETEQSTSVGKITIKVGCATNAQTKTNYQSNHIRFYAGSYLVLSVPDGFVITNVKLNRYSDDTWNGDKVTPSEGSFVEAKAGTAPLVWNGCSNSIRFDYSGQCRTASVEVVYAKSVTIASSGYSTLSCDEDLDFANAVAGNETADALVAYIIPSNDGAKLTMSTVTEAPAGTGILLKGTPSVTYTIPVKTNAASVGTNLLKAGPVTVPEGNQTIYLLSGGQFHIAAAGTTSVGKAYLELPAAVGAPALSIDNDDETTGIGMTTVNGQQTTDGVYYDLSGRRVAQPTKGLYIVNGKKIVIK